jgi:VWA domain-containing protein
MTKIDGGEGAVTHDMSSPTRQPQLDIQLHVDHDPDLRPHRGARIEAHLRVDVAATGAATDLPAVELALIIAVDVADTHRAAVWHALPSALRALPDGVSFAVLGSGPEPRRCYPLGDVPWAVADRNEKRRAAFAAGAVPLHRDGPRPAGYAPWVAGARALLAARPLSVRHLLLITDGSSAPGETRLEEELDACAGQFTSDVFAVGTDWPPAPLLTLAERLHGSAEAVSDGLGSAIGTAVQRLRRVRTPELPIEVTVRPAVRRVALNEKAPRPHRLGGQRQTGRPLSWSFPTHQWEPGSRDYQLTLVADPDTDPLETELQFAMVSIGEVRRPVTGRWHRPRQSAPPGPAGGGSLLTMNATTQMRTALRAGLVALREHERGDAERHLGRAARLATRFGGPDWVLDEILEVAEIEDAPAGRIRLRSAVDGHALGSMILRAGSHPGGLLTDAVGREPGPSCPHCGTPAGSEARHCIACGRRLP